MITQGDRGERGEQGPQGPMVPIRMVCVLSFCTSYTFSFMPLPRFQGYPGEKGSSDIIDFNGELRDAFRVSASQASAIDVRFTAPWCTVCRQAFITVSQAFRHEGKQVQELKRKKLEYLLFFFPR